MIQKCVVKSLRAAYEAAGAPDCLSRSPSLLGHTNLTVPQRPELIDNA